MRFVIQVLMTAGLCFLLQTFLPWWTMPIGAFAIGFVFTNTPGKSFLAGFLAAGLLWLGFSLYIDFATQSILTERVAQLLSLNVFVITSLLGGIVGGMASLTGSLLKP